MRGWSNKQEERQNVEKQKSPHKRRGIGSWRIGLPLGSERKGLLNSQDGGADIISTSTACRARSL